MIFSRMLIRPIHPAFVRSDPTLVERDDATGRKDRLGPVCDDDPGQGHLAQGVVDRTFARDVEMAGRLVEQHDPWRAVECARQ
jgi:hypothetical protein